MPTIAPSPLREPAHRSFPKAMEDFDIERVQDDFAAAARRCREGDLDGCEFVFTGHMNDQFICPADQPAHRSIRRQPREPHALSISRCWPRRAQQAGSDFLIGIRITGDDLLEGGNSMQDCLEILKRFGSSAAISIS